MNLAQPEIINYTELEELRAEQIALEVEQTKLKRIWNTFKKQWPIFLMLIPVLVFFLLFRYRPILELTVAFKRNEPMITDTFQESWYGFHALKMIMFGNGNPTISQEFWRAFRNTFTLSMYGLLFGFPMPIILALLFSEIKSDGYRSITQIITYLPKFISTVVITSILFLMLKPGETGAGGQIITHPGILTQIMQWMGLPMVKEGYQSMPQYFRSIYIISDIWEGAGYGSIVYFAAIMAISPTNYEAAKIDGANKLAQIRYVTLPGMAPTLTIMLILRIGGILTVGYEKIYLMTLDQGMNVLEDAEVLSTFVIRMTASFGGGQTNVDSALQEAIATSADLFNSFIAMFLVLGANFISRRVSDTSLF
jgi:putative aldouronate transport system permease protein